MQSLTGTAGILINICVYNGIGWGRLTGINYEVSVVWPLEPLIQASS